MNLVSLTYIIEVAKSGSISKAAQSLLIAQPNLSRSIKELESELGITLFNRTFKGMTLTPEGEEFLGYAKKIIGQIEEIEHMYRNKTKMAPKQIFSICVPRASYIANAFARFSLKMTDGAAEFYYKETNSSHTISNVLSSEYNLGIIRYAKKFSSYFNSMFEEKRLAHRLVKDFRYVLITHREGALASQKQIRLSDLDSFIEIAHADPFVPSLALAAIKREELPETVKRRIFVFERGSQFDLLANNKETFMWVSPIPKQLLERYNLAQRECADNEKEYQDVLIYREDYYLSELDKLFLLAL